MNLELNEYEICSKQYRILELIGSGSYGSVCKAYSENLNKYVAIKKISKAFSCFQMAKRTFREIKILNILEHENLMKLIKVLDFDEKKPQTQQDVYLVLDLMETDLHRVIYSRQILNEDHIRLI